ncbi:RluA family pseudouridine synthase [Ectobacillus ponti]|uniref:Pseudouridine synthase n=1 Tax=Ectobacillus ponti TaxID=2961894 RepID=A0AA41X4B6_9BACI|nr:RluA family pseudouridine synthase [Ectobacillus ponti]MCP8968477.1 RluA family pseudouridine synthase [Ectobacillus ponti]
MQTRKMGEWCEVQVPGEWNGRSIDSILKEEWQVPKKLLHRYRMEKSVRHNGAEAPWSALLKEGDKLGIRMFTAEPYGVEPEYMEIEVLYEDDHVLIVHKPAGMDTHPADAGGGGTLANGVAFHLQMEGVETKVRHIHRLDQDTTGAVVFAKHALAGVIMDRLLTERQIKREYEALAEGRLRQKKGTIDAPIGRDRHHPTRRRVSPNGDRAVTHYQVERYDRSQDVTLVRLQLDTGRTHQIRVHMSHIGHPLLGDALYGSRRAGMGRQALHARRVSLQHPITGEQLTVEAPLPTDFSALLQP